MLKCTIVCVKTRVYSINSSLLIPIEIAHLLKDKVSYKQNNCYIDIKHKNPLNCHLLKSIPLFHCREFASKLPQLCGSQP